MLLEKGLITIELEETDVDGILKGYLKETIIVINVIRTFRIVIISFETYVRSFIAI